MVKYIPLLTPHPSVAIGERNRGLACRAGDFLRDSPRGQVMLEFAISLIGLVMLTYVVLNVWVWMARMIPERQAAFQRTRLAAGSSEPGKRVRYKPPLLALIGPPGSRGEPAELPPILEAPCSAAEPLFQEARDLFNEANTVLRPLMEDELQQSRDHGEQAEDLAKKMGKFCPGHPACYELYSGWIEGQSKKAKKHATAAQGYSDQMQANFDLARAKIQEGQELCESVQ